MAVTKAGEGQAQATATYEHELLAGGADQEADAALPRHDPGAAIWTNSTAGSGMTGRSSCIVLTGVIRLYTEFYEPVDLRRGDSAYYDAAMGHNVISLSEEDATILWVTSLV